MWLTTFQTAGKTMTHISDNVKVICDFSSGTITTIYYDNPIDEFSFIENEMTIGEYDMFLEAAEQLITIKSWTNL
jgi:hypothetical protein